MAGIPANLGRVPNMLASRLALTNISGTNLQILRLNEQLATQRAINRPSDDTVKAATIGVLDDRLERSTQLIRNYQHARASLGIAESMLTEATGLATEANRIALEQVNTTVSASQRESQAVVIDQLLRSLFNIANREGVAGYALGGSTPGTQPVTEFFGYYRFNSFGQGLTTDMDQASTVPITLGPGPIAGRSGRVQGSVDLNPRLTNATRLADLGGARGTGVAVGPVEMSINGGPRVRVELTGADTIRDVADRIQQAIRTYETDNSVSVLNTGGVGVGGAAGEALSLDVLAGASVQFFEVGTGQTAGDLGLTSSPPIVFTSTSANGVGLAPRLTMTSPVSSLAGVSGALGSVRISNAGRSAVVDLSGATTIQDIRNRIEGANLGVRVMINRAGTGIDVVNEVAAGSANAMSISEVGGGDTATRLGIRSLSGVTRMADFNFGRGVQVVDGVADPITGTVNASLNTDMRITLGDGSQTPITIDLRPTDLTNVANVLSVMNSQIQTQLSAAGLPSTALVARLAPDGNGIALAQDPSYTQPIGVVALNNSGLAEGLGLLEGTYDATTRTLTGQDRAKVRIESLFSHLVDLRDTLRSNNLRGIGFAGNALDKSLEDLAQERGLVGSFMQRVEESATREEDRATLDEATRSQLRDLDFTEAATRFSLLQTQLQAGLRATAVTQQQSLLDFL